MFFLHGLRREVIGILGKRGYIMLYCFIRVGPKYAVD
jgi:hypothetical protein